MAISGVVGGIYKASGKVNFTNEAMTNTGDNMTYKITDTNRRYWDRTAIFTVKKDGVTQSSGFVIEHAGGQVVFAASQGAGVITVTGAFIPLFQVGGGFNWKLDIESDLLEATTFGSNGWKEFVPALNGFSGSFEKYWLTEDRKNMLPPTSDPAWSLHANATPTATNTLSLVATAANQYTQINIPVSPNTTYTLTVPITASTGNASVDVEQFDSVGTLVSSLPNSVSGTSGTLSVTFTTLAGTSVARVLLYSSIAGTFTFTNPQFELGTASSYAHRVVLEDDFTKDLAFVFYVDAGANKWRYEGFGELSKTGIETPIDGLIKQSIDFSGDGKLYYRVG